MSSEEMKDILVRDLPRKPSVEFAMRVHAIRIDAFRVCFGCIKALGCDPQNIVKVERNYWTRENDPNLKAAEACPDFEFDPGKD
jgi:hypothetical protein